MTNFNNPNERRVWEESVSDLFVNDGRKITYEDLPLEEPIKEYHFGYYRDTHLIKYRDCLIVETDIPTLHLFFNHEADKAFAMARARSQRNNMIARAMG
jgi:hypothetical protein